jgi:hypothetical protein
MMRDYVIDSAHQHIIIFVRAPRLAAWPLVELA